MRWPPPGAATLRRCSRASSWRTVAPASCCPASRASPTEMADRGLRVAVTGPTGDLGIALVTALEASGRVERIVAMARRPFDPSSEGWRRTEYRQGDVRDKESVREAVHDADVVVHLAFAIMGAEAGREINVEGSRNVFEAAVE